MFDPEYPERAASIGALATVGRELDQAIGLIGVQLGPASSATTALEEAGESLSGAYRAIRGMRYRTAAGGRPIMRIEERNEKLEAQFDRERDAFKSAVSRFVERAHAIAGARLPDEVTTA
jgi:hypothetical protein